jgi:hypothetical protein
VARLPIFRRMTLTTALVVALLSVVFLAPHQPKAAAACAALPTDKGTVTQTITVPASGTYRVWSRVLGPDTANNSFYMQIDSTLCSTSIGGSTSIPANTWTWVDYQNGTSTSKVNVTLTAGSHTITMAGQDANVEVDRVILTADTSCVPTGTGDNCANPPDTTPPTVAITAPTTGSTVSGTVSVTTTAADDVAVTKVELYVDGTLNATDSASPYTFSLNTTSLSVGSHALIAKAYDAAGNVTSSATVSVTKTDTTAPTVSLTAPTAGSTLAGTIALTATASDNVGVSKVEFYVDGTLKGTDSASPYSLSLDTTTLTNASHSFTAKAYDAAGNVTTSAAVSATVSNGGSGGDTTPPVVSMTNPTAGSTISGTTALTATATDNVGVSKVEFYVDGTLKNSDTVSPYSFSLDTTTLSNASHSLTAKAYDAAGNITTSASVSVTVSNVVIIPEDINQDGHVDLLDFSLLAQKFNQSGTGIGRADINGDGVVNLLDFSRLASKYGQ